MEEREIDLGDLFKALGKSLFKNILLGMILACLAFIISSFVVAPKYESSVTMIVNSEMDKQDKNEQLNLNDVQLSQKLVNTYTEILKTRGVADRVIKNLGLNMEYDDFQKKISIVSKEDSEVFEVKVMDTNPQRAADIANETAKVFKDSLIKIMKIDNVQILDKAVVADKQTSPNIMKDSLISFIIGFLIGNFVTMYGFIKDTSIKDAGDISKTFDLPVLGEIPRRKSRR